MRCCAHLDIFPVSEVAWVHLKGSFPAPVVKAGCPDLPPAAANDVLSFWLIAVELMVIPCSLRCPLDKERLRVL